MWWVVLRQESRTGPRYKYESPTIVRHTINPIQVTYFFQLRPPLRSSRVDLDEFFSKYGCIDPVDLHCLSVSTIMAYTSIRTVASIRSTSIMTLVWISYRLLSSSSTAASIWSTSTARTRLRSSYQLYLRVAFLQIDSLSYRYCFHYLFNYSNITSLD